MKFKEWLNEAVSNPIKIHNSFSQNTVGTHNDTATASFLPSTWTGTEDLGPFGHGLPSTDLVIPTTEVKSKIRSIVKNKNPIAILLMDGTKIYLSIDEFNRINSFKNLAVGEELTVTFQRSPEDKGSETSKIVNIR